MANRGMLPKFRPATLGGRDGARPMIRPVGKPTAPPPPPSPPRRERVSSGVRHPHGPAIEGHQDLQTPAFCDPPTMAAARQRIHEIARELPRDSDRMAPRFDDETQARPVDDAHDLIRATPYHAHVQPLDAPYEALPSLEAPQYGYSEPPPPSSYAEPSTQARGYDHNNNRYENEHDENDGYDDGYGQQDQYSEQYSDPPPPPPAQFNRTAAYPGSVGPNSEDSGPRQRLRKNAGAVPQYDAAAYEANYGRREGSFQRRQQQEPVREPQDSGIPETEAPAPRRGESSFQSPPRTERQESYQPPQQHQSYQRARKQSGERAREREWSAPQPEIPQAPRVPQDMKVPAGFVMGVQPIRTPVSSIAIPHEAFPPLVQQPLRVGTPMMGIPYGQPQHQAHYPQHAHAHAPGTMAASPRAMHHQQPMHMQHGQHGHQQHMHVRPPTTNVPVGHQLQMTEVEEAQQGSKVGRFAWFVFGAAFGIFFAFFATGFVPRLGKKEEITFPNPPALPQQQAPVAAAPPPPVQAPLPPPVVQQAPPPPPVQQFAPVAPPPPVVVAVAPKTPAPPPTFVSPPPAAAPPGYGGVIAASPAAAAPAAPAAPAPKVAAAPAARGQRAGTIARRPPAAAKAPAGDRDDDAPAPAPKPKAEKSGGGGDGIGDLLNAGIGP